MSRSTAWVVLHKRYGEDIRHPSDRELTQAVDELFDERIEGMTEADYLDHPNAWLRYGFDDGPEFVAEASRNQTATLAKYADQDDVDPVAEATFNMDRNKIVSLWRLLAEGKIEEIRRAYPRCGW
jgi:hypothetical protein